MVSCLPWGVSDPTPPSVAPSDPLQAVLTLYSDTDSTGVGGYIVGAYVPKGQESLCSSFWSSVLTCSSPSTLSLKGITALVSRCSQPLEVGSQRHNELITIRMATSR